MYSRSYKTASYLLIKRNTFFLSFILCRYDFWWCAIVRSHRQHQSKCPSGILWDPTWILL